MFVKKRIISSLAAIAFMGCSAMAFSHGWVESPPLVSSIVA
jgi:hypothetical protein